jgi:transposase
MASMPAQPAPVTVGVDTHADSQVAAVVDQTGRVLGSASFAASTRGYVALVNWAERLGPVAKIGIEGTGTYGAGLARFVRAYGLEVVEVDRPDRRTRRCLGKSDPIDAEAAARATLSGVASTTPKTREGHVEMIRVLRVARRGAMKARVAAGGQLPRRWPGPAWPCDQDHCAILSRPPRPPCGPWPGAGTTCRRNWTPWMSSSPSWSARPRQRCWPCLALAWTPPGNCW